MGPQHAKLVRDYLDRTSADTLSLLERLARIESPSSTPASQDAVLAIIAGELQGLGYRVRRLPGRNTGGHLYAAPQGRVRGQPVQLLLGHCDTVWPLGTLESMPLAREGDTLRGPGVYDMKAGLAQIVAALRALRALELRPDVQPLVLVNSDEEIGSRESGRYIRRLARVADRALVLEPSLGPAGKLKTLRKGVGRFTIKVRGKAAHAGLDPQAGASAILELSHVIQKLFALNDAQRGVSVNVGMIDGGLRPNVIAPESSATVDVRVPTQEDAQRIEAAIRQLRPETLGVALHIEGRFGRPPLERTPANVALWAIAQETAKALGFALEEGMAGGGSDGSTTSLYTPTLDGLGAVGDGAHAPHEHVSIDRIAERSALLTLLMLAPPMKASGNPAASAGGVHP